MRKLGDEGADATVITVAVAVVAAAAVVAASVAGVVAAAVVEAAADTELVLVRHCELWLPRELYGEFDGFNTPGAPLLLKSNTCSSQY
jgi:succinylarginine dihydrolase